MPDEKFELGCRDVHTVEIWARCRAVHQAAPQVVAGCTELLWGFIHIGPVRKASSEPAPYLTDRLLQHPYREPSRECF